MEWLLVNPQITSVFGSLGSYVDDVYLINDDCLRNLEEIIYKLAFEDLGLRTFRRALWFGQNVKNDIVPLLVNAKDPEIIDAAVRLMVNLTIPIECLLPLEITSMSEIGRHAIFELNKLLITSKEAFVEWKNTKAVIDHMTNILEKDSKLSVENCDSINNCLLLLRNILHVPENSSAEDPGGHPRPSTTNTKTSFQNQIIWNLFTQSIDKLLIYLMSCPQRGQWAVTMAQLIALMYKDQHVNTLQKLLNIWFESTMTESSDDNESNTSPPQQCSGDSSPLLTSDPTSDSSDNGSGKKPASPSNSPDQTDQVSKKSTELPTQTNLAKATNSHELHNQSMETGQENSSSAKHSDTNSTSERDAENPLSTSNDSEKVKKCSVSFTVPDEIQALQPSLQIQSETAPSTLDCTNAKSETSDSATTPKPPTTIIIKSSPTPPASPSKTSITKPPSDPSAKMQNQVSVSETSDCGYGTQAEKEFVSTSSNEDDSPYTKPVHQKPRQNQKQRLNAANKQQNPISIQEKKELRRKKLVKRGKSNIINMKGLIHHSPSDDDISHIMKEFTVDFLLKGYSLLVQELHAQLLSDVQVQQIDTSHFFWLVTYFLKFAAQLELDMEHVNGVLSFEIVSYLTYEGVMLCEQMEQLSREPHTDMMPLLRRIHLVVTGIREFLQALETYKKSTHLTKEDSENIARLEIQICLAEDLKCLFVLLIRCYNATAQNRQYLQDLIVTNHVLLLLLDHVGETKTDIREDMMVHIKRFATAEVMYQYGLLLEDFRDNGAFVNDCIFTMMHHVGGDLGQINVLFQPTILRTFSQIWETEYEVCDDWSDLIEYVIHKFCNTPQPSPLVLTNTLPEISKELLAGNLLTSWTQEEKNSLQWYYVQCKQSKCLIADIWKLFQENGNLQKSRVSIIEQLWELDIISLTQYDLLMKVENPDFERNVQTPAFSVASEHSDMVDDENSTSSTAVDDIQVLRDRLLKENKGHMIIWLQKSLLDCCYVRLKQLDSDSENPFNVDDKKDIIRAESVSYHCIVKKKSIPVVPWTQEHVNVLSYQPFVLLLQKLGFHLATDAKKLFVRIPEFWTADILYNVALKLGVLEQSITKFDLKYLETALLLEKPPEAEVSEINLDSIESHDRSKKPNSVNSSTQCRCATDVPTDWLQVVITNNDTESPHAMILPIPPDPVNFDYATHPEDIASEEPAAESKLKSTLSVIEEVPNCEQNDETAAKSDDDDDDDDDNKLDRVDGPRLEEHDIVSACETASVASDLMYVSDEEDKHDIISPLD